MSLVEMGDGARFGQHIFGKDARQLVLADHHLDVDAEVVGRPEDLDDAADGRTRGRGPTGDLDIDDEAFKALPGFRVLDAAVCFTTQHAMRRGGPAAGGISAPGGMRMGCVMRSSKGRTTLLIVGRDPRTCRRSETCRRRWSCGAPGRGRCGPAGGRRLWADRLRPEPGRPAWRR